MVARKAKRTTTPRKASAKATAGARRGKIAAAKRATREKAAPGRQTARALTGAAKGAAPRTTRTIARGRRATRPGAVGAPAAARTSPPSTSGIDEIAETLAIVVPELSARLAALEHLLIEQKACTRDELKRARAFVDMRRGGG